ncbi:MAG TPA: hypothetical protein VK589_13005 [Chryseolinea sp.]|nr:hypothetical protein [Chryseolinea sp.]
MFNSLKEKIESLTSKFEIIPSTRRATLAHLASYIREKVNLNEPAQLNFICTHNSRRSHIAQVWAEAAAHFYGIPRVKNYSGGTEATAVNPNVIAALRHTGFKITVERDLNNPVYSIHISSDHNIKAFSKRYDDSSNPSKDFAAVMVCSDADQNCPFVPGAAQRIAITYEDPKKADGSPLETAAYRQTVDEIGREMLYVFSMINTPKSPSGT